MSYRKDTIFVANGFCIESLNLIYLPQLLLMLHRVGKILSLNETIRCKPGGILHHHSEDEEKQIIDS